MASEVTCLGCKEPFDAETFLNACSAWHAELDCVAFCCPRCSSRGEARLETGRFWHGYVYAAGTAHFSAEVAVAAPSLVIQQTAAGLGVTWGAAQGVIPRR
jgi:hypothetical protein